MSEYDSFGSLWLLRFFSYNRYKKFDQWKSYVKLWRNTYHCFGKVLQSTLVFSKRNVLTLLRNRSWKSIKIRIIEGCPRKLSVIYWWQILMIARGKFKGSHWKINKFDSALYDRMSNCPQVRVPPLLGGLILDQLLDLLSTLGRTVASLRY